MKKDLGVVPAVYPMPVLMVAAYDANEKVNVMNVAWGQICDMDKIILFIGEGKKTWLNIKESKAFTVALADEAHVDVADFFGIASGNKIDDKFERTGYHAVKSDKVHAPIIEEFPVVMECELLEFVDTEHISGIVGKIVNVKAEESVLSENGNNSRRGGFGAPEGTRTHTLKAREPKSRMSTNSITGANRKRRCWPPLKSLYFDTGRFPRRSKTLYPHTVTDGVFILPQPSPLDKWANANAAQNFLVHTN